MSRFLSIWFRYLKTNWFVRHHHIPGDVPFVLACPDHGRMVITAANTIAQAHGIRTSMVVADARVIIPSLKVFDDEANPNKVLNGLAEWCIRYTPSVAI